ncbi:SAM-dependent methyltransferase [Streptomyces litchfieldiae]|uniref:Class I SAM-dependent methyltransferase n=1 Tax=Streptomyces litchfieldiae TaxID=3075543 RepID=A0ABU2N0E8_9ACTN|nr:class I SAM-dependent methyltransferase [Streptomyces sp. DSM 44938]MDT0347245.1 class I SAM-dependent methyltransferase [Streptomyces sp. DSM 44938]
MDSYARHLITHAGHPIAGPLTEAALADVLDAALAHRPDAGRLLDLGCGQAVWPLRALTARPGARAVGVDVNGAALAWAAEEAARLGVADRLELREASATGLTWDEPFDAVLCVGATHAFGGLLPTLAAARAPLAPGGCVVVGEGFWERDPDPAALAALEAAREDYGDLATTVERVVAAGWEPVYGHVSTPGEWDDYEWRWTGNLARWALDHPDHPDAAAAAETAAAHRAGWLRGYRGVLGFVTLVLRATCPPVRTGG